MKEYTIGEIEKWTDDNICGCGGKEIIRSLIEQLNISKEKCQHFADALVDEIENSKNTQKEVARECVKIIEGYTSFCPGAIELIRKKYGVDNAK